MQAGRVSARQKNGSNQSVAVCGWELAHNPAGRVITLAQLYAQSFDVEIIGCIFPFWGEQLWEPVREMPFPKHILTVHDESRFIEQATALVASHPYDTVHLSKPRIVNIFIGLLYKVIWGARILVDIDDEELAFVGADSCLDLDQYIAQHGSLPELRHLSKNLWTRLAVGLVDIFDGITVSNVALQRRYGGTVIAHARDENVFTSSLVLKRKSRQRFGIPQDVQVVLFLGTPRAHKGLLETAQSIAALCRDDVIFLVVGNFEDPGLKPALQAIQGVHFHFLGNQPFSGLHEVVALGDVCVLFQDVDSLVSKFQMPAKLSDALGMGLSVLATRTPPLEQAFAAGALLPVEHNTLTAQLSAALENTPLAAATRDAGRHWFQSELSLSLNAKRLYDFVVSRSSGFGWYKTFKKMRSLFPNEVKTLSRYCFSVSVKHSNSTISPRIAFVVHVNQLELWPGIARRLSAQRSCFDLFITTIHELEEKIREDVRKDFPDARIRAFPDCGMDIVPFLSIMPDLIAAEYDAVCKLHTEKGSKGNKDRLCQESMLENPVTSDVGINTIGKAFVQDPDLALVGPGPFYLSAGMVMGDNEKDLFRLFGLTCKEDFSKQNWGIFAGTSFWFRPLFFKQLAGMTDKIMSCLEDTYHRDGQNIHVLESLMGLVSSLNQKHIGLLHQNRSEDQLPALQILVEPNQDIGRAGVGQVLRQLSTLASDHALISESGLFDASYYLSHQPGLVGLGVDPVIHYLLIGRFRGLRPCPDFDSAWYIAKYTEKIEKNTDALVHYLRCGVHENLSLREDLKAQQKDLPGFRFKALNSVLINWQELAEQQRNSEIVSIVIPVLNQPELTTACVQSLSSCTGSTRFELILVDNGSNRTTREVLDDIAREYGWIRVLHNEENLNFALGCNLGFAASKGEKVVFLNNDTTVTPGWLDAIIAPLDRTDISAVQPLLLYPDGLVQCMGVVFSKKSVLGYPLYAGMQPEAGWTDRSRTLQAVTGACMAVRAADFIRARGFDPLFVNGQEDVDLCLRINRYKRRTCWYESTSRVYHHESRTEKRHAFNEYNRKKFIRRWRGAITPDDTQHYETDGFMIVGYDADKKKNIRLSTWRPRLKK
ncbi:MAG: glycosyltransferase [Desulfobulbaceae bacterium]|nr:glycosyltransferase [Desulfobulbaceae bacterium]